MSADKMPPLPGMHTLWQAVLNWADHQHHQTAAAALEAEVNAYARAYAAEQTRKLVEALESTEPPEHNPWGDSLNNCISGDNYLRGSEYRDLISELDALYRLRALIAKHKEQP
jgi:arylsulfatase A-like enzyme